MGIIVKLPAAANNPSSYPDVLAVHVIVAAIGLAATAVSVFANNNSTKENMKQKNVIPIPTVIVGINILKKNLKMNNHLHMLFHLIL